MATFAGVVGIVQANIQGDKNIPFAQSATTGRSIVESSAGGLALDTTLTNTNTKLDTSNTHLNDLVNLNSSINAYSGNISLSTALSKDLQTTSNIYTNATSVNTGLIATSTATTATNTGTTATNTAAIATTNTTLTTTNNLLTINNWLGQRVFNNIYATTAITSLGSYTTFAGPYDLFLASPVSPFTPAMYYNSITISGRMTGGITTSPTLCFSYSYDNITFYSEGIYPTFSPHETSGFNFILQRINIPYRYVRIRTVAQTITLAGHSVTLQHI
jgi:hypothetical protein